MELYEKYKSAFDKYGVNTSLRISHFMGQAETESGFQLKRENMNYSAESLGRVFHKYFPTIELSNQYAHNTIGIANRVYSARMGNGSEVSGDGWKYRGGGYFQITGKVNFQEMSKDTGIDFVSNPDLILEEPNAIISALWYWDKTGLNSWADKDDCDAISDLINIGHHTPKIGDAIGYAKRKEFTEKWKTKLK